MITSRSMSLLRVASYFLGDNRLQVNVLLKSGVGRLVAVEALLAAGPSVPPSALVV